MTKSKAKLKTKTSEAKLQELAEQFTHTMATGGITACCAPNDTGGLCGGT